MSHIIALVKPAIGEDDCMLFVIGQPVLKYDEVMRHNLVIATGYTKKGKILNITQSDSRCCIQFEHGTSSKIKNSKFKKIIEMKHRDTDDSKVPYAETLFAHGLPAIVDGKIILPGDDDVAIAHNIKPAPTYDDISTLYPHVIPRTMLSEPKLVQVQPNSPHIIIDCEFGRHYRVVPDKDQKSGYRIDPTGSGHGDYVLQIAAIEYDANNQARHIFNHFVYDSSFGPTEIIRALKLSQLSYAQYVQDGNPTSIVKVFIQEVLSKHLPLGFWDAHNDLRALQQLCESVFRDLSVEERHIVQQPMQYFDVANNALAFMYDEGLNAADSRQNLSLNCVARILGLKNQHQHHALYDVSVTGEVLHQLHYLRTHELRPVDIPTITAPVPLRIAAKMIPNDIVKSDDLVEAATDESDDDESTIESDPIVRIFNDAYISDETVIDVKQYLDDLCNHNAHKLRISNLQTLIQRYHKYESMMEQIQKGDSDDQIAAKVGYSKLMVYKLRNHKILVSDLQAEIQHTAEFYQELDKCLSNPSEFSYDLPVKTYNKLKRKVDANQQYRHNYNQNHL